MTQHDAQTLHAVLEDLQRHLLWQVQQLGPELLLETGHLEQVRALARQQVSSGRPGRQEGGASSAGGGLGALREQLRQRAGETASRPQPRGGPSGPSSTGAASVSAPSGGQAPEATPAWTSRSHALGPQRVGREEVVAAETTASAPAADPGQIVAAVSGSPEAAQTLTELRTSLLDCRRCRLCESRTQVVFGTGNPRAELVFVGEAPGAEEDRQGMPFVGESGRLLTKMIEAMGYSRDDVYICNVIKCRPPNNRNPGPDELARCEPFLRQQLGMLAPKVLVALGKFAAQALLRESKPISSLRGIWREYEGIPLMPTFHPAYLLRQPNEKRKVWVDLQDVMKRLDRTR